MRIIKMGRAGTLTDARALLERRGCPYCGETKRAIEYKDQWMHKGIAKCVQPKVFKKGLFKRKTWQVDRYYCQTCGCEWEGEPYEQHN